MLPMWYSTCIYVLYAETKLHDKYYSMSIKTYNLGSDKVLTVLCVYYVHTCTCIFHSILPLSLLSLLNTITTIVLTYWKSDLDTDVFESFIIQK